MRKFGVSGIVTTSLLVDTIKRGGKISPELQTNVFWITTPIDANRYEYSLFQTRMRDGHSGIAELEGCPNTIDRYGWPVSMGWGKQKIPTPHFLISTENESTHWAERWKLSLSRGKSLCRRRSGGGGVARRYSNKIFWGRKPCCMPVGIGFWQLA